MEVGAVKQAFNNEVINLKKKLDQAKIQIINKLTRKAKTLTQKKHPEHLAEKLKRKATAAVNDVMAIKKINNKILAKFAITHTGNLNDFLNKPTTSPAERACARLLLHKALQDKYQLLRNRFTDVPIKDLFMSRQERLKIKKEEKNKQKLKKKEKEDRKRRRETEKKNEQTPIQAEGDWSVEDIDIDELILNKKFVPKRRTEDDGDNDGSDSETGDKKDVAKSINDLNSNGGSNDEPEGEKAESDNELSVNESEDDIDNDDVSSNSGDDNDDDEEGNNQHVGENDEEPNSDLVDEHAAENDADDEPNSDLCDEESKFDNESNESKQIKLTEKINSKTDNPKLEKPSNKKLVKEDNRKKLPKLPKQNCLNKDKSKTKTFSEKMQTKKISKKHSDSIETPQSNKMVDPFFITVTGENYMSVVEPRGPDEVKDTHTQGNRQMRRAAMFGYVPKNRPKFNNFSNNKRGEKGDFSKNSGNSRFGDKNCKFDMQNGYRNRDSGHDNKFEKQDGYQKREFGSNNFKSNDSSANNRERRQNFKRKFEAADNFDKKSSEPEKLHPSWAAKKKISGIQPFQGKKTVFE